MENSTAPTPLIRYHQVMRAIAVHPAGLGLSGLSNATGLPRSTTHRLAVALCGVGYLEEAAGVYAMGPAFTELLRLSLTADSRVDAFQPALQFLATELKETAFFARFVDGKVQLTHAITPALAERSYIYPGVGDRPLDRCSSSKAILAWLDPTTVQSLFEDGDLTLDLHAGSIDGFLAGLRQVHDAGYAVCDGDIDEGAFSLACPVPVGATVGVFSIGVVGPSSRMKAYDVLELVKVVRDAASMASNRLLGIA